MDRGGLDEVRWRIREGLLCQSLEADSGEARTVADSIRETGQANGKVLRLTTANDLAGHRLHLVPGAGGRRPLGWWRSGRDGAGVVVGRGRTGQPSKGRETRVSMVAARPFLGKSWMINYDIMTMSFRDS